MGKVILQEPLKSIHGQLLASDPYYFRIYPVSKEELARRADKARGVERGLWGLNVLIYGWLKYRKYGEMYRKKIYNRDWLHITEVLDLSDYAGCDLLA